MIQFDVAVLRELLLAEIVARTNVTDIRPGSEAADFLEAWVQATDGVADAVWEVRDAGLLDGNSGEDLRALARSRGVEYTRGLRAVGGQQTFGRTASDDMPEVAIPVGTPVYRRADGVRYVTATAATLAADATWSTPVDVVAVQTGTNGNCVAGAIDTLGATVPGVTLTRNAATITNGVDDESDESLRARVRTYQRGLGRAVPPAVITAALRATDSVGRQARFAELSLVDEATPGIGTLWIDDGTGNCETFASIDAGEVLLAEAAGGETVLYLANRPVRTAPQILVNAAGVPYVLQKPYGRVILDTALASTDAVVAGAYTAYTGLVAAVQAAIDGLFNAPLTNPGYVAYGVILSVRGAQKVATSRGDSYLPVSGNLIVAEDADAATVLSEAKIALLTAINARPICNGANQSIASLSYAQAIGILLGVAGVVDVQDLKIDGVAAGKTATVGRVLRSIDDAIDLS
jgi:hypothetical protein